MDIGFAFIIGFIGSLLLTPFAIQASGIIRILDRPDGVRKFQRNAVPALGGVAVMGALIAAGIYTAFFAYTPGELIELAALVCSIITMCILGVIDDRVQFRARAKLLGQILIVLPTILVVGTIDTVVLFDTRIPLGMMAWPVTIFWFLAIINAMNLIDGMDGLASSIGLVSAIGLAIVSAIHFQTVPMAVTLALAGTLCGFLLFNLPNAKIYLGDCGSMSIGLILATVSIRMSPENGVLYFSPAFFCLFLPLYDTALAIVRRRLTGRGIGQGDCEHIHHRLLQKGFDVWNSLQILVLLHLGFVTLGCFSALSHFEWIVWSTAGFVIYWCARYKFIGQNEWRLSYLFVKEATRPARLFFARFMPTEQEDEEEEVPPIPSPAVVVNDTKIALPEVAADGKPKAA